MLKERLLTPLSATACRDYITCFFVNFRRVYFSCKTTRHPSHPVAKSESLDLLCEEIEGFVTCLYENRQCLGLRNGVKLTLPYPPDPDKHFYHSSKPDVHTAPGHFLIIKVNPTITTEHSYAVTEKIDKAI